MDRPKVFLALFVVVFSTSSKYVNTSPISTESTMTITTETNVVLEQELSPESKNLHLGETVSTTELLLSQTKSLGTTQTPTNEKKSKDNTRGSAAVRYEFHAHAKHWLGAVLACWREGGQLAVPHSSQEAEALSALLTATEENNTYAYDYDAIHVGISDLWPSSGGEWRTLNGMTPIGAGFDCWLGDRHSGRLNNCGALLRNGLYVSSSCDSSLPYVCEMPGDALGYTNFPGLGSYRVHEQPLRWIDALQQCKSEAASLVEISSPLEAGFLAGMFIMHATHNKTRSKGFFVGINDIAEEGVWRTVSGVELNNSSYYNSWSTTQSSIERRGNCGILLPFGKYDSCPCVEPMAFCCKRTRFTNGFLLQENQVYVSSETEYPYFHGYRLHAQESSWLEALLKCHKENATLAVPSSRTEISEMYYMIRNAGYYPSIRVHLGLHKFGGAILRTLEDQPHSMDFLVSSSNDDGRYLCVSGEIYDERLHLITTDCRTKRLFICEKPVHTTDTPITSVEHEELPWNDVF